ncbi:MAG TPA: Gfo/Idh/MocA family oxidoreductase [Casimicrobiaceae bacterium]|nr:Gfo/Idh/MocA family oxidoreductase [Casimicrobiaceae bacterium]
MPTSNRRIGIIGVGFGAQVHVPAFRSEGWDVAAICSREREKARKAAAEAGIEGIHSDAMELIGRPDLDAVSIITPPSAHHALSVAALRAGKHVLCEKPFAMDVREGREMLAAAEKSRRTAMIAHEFRHTPQRAYIRRLLRDGYIGAFRLCTIELFLDRYVTPKPRPLSWMARKADGGGLLGALGSHYIDALRDWFGEIASVSGRLETLRPDLVDERSGRAATADSDDTFTMTLTFEHGGLATMIASFATTPSRGAKIAVMGEEGTLTAEQPGPNPLEDGVVVASRRGSLLQPLPTPVEYAPFKDPRDHRLMAFRLLVRDFTRGIEQGTSPSPNFVDGLRCQQVLDAVRESSATGRAITLESAASAR